jgi:hypothetical protein
VSDPFSDPFKDTGSFSSRLQGFIGSVGAHASSHHVEHFKARAQQVGGQAAQQATQLGGQAADRAVGFAADNPDTMERAGEKLGERIGRAAIPVPFVGKKIGGAVGRRVGRSLSAGAQARTGGASQPFDSSDPFGGVDLSRSTHSEPNMAYNPDLDPFADSWNPPSSPQGGSSGMGYDASSDPFAGSQPAQQEEAPKKKMFGRKKKSAEPEQQWTVPDDPFA